MLRYIFVSWLSVLLNAYFLEATTSLKQGRGAGPSEGKQRMQKHQHCHRERSNLCLWLAKLDRHATLVDDEKWYVGNFQFT